MLARLLASQWLWGCRARLALNAVYVAHETHNPFAKVLAKWTENCGCICKPLSFLIFIDGSPISVWFGFDAISFSLCVYLYMYYSTISNDMCIFVRVYVCVFVRTLYACVCVCIKMQMLLKLFSMICSRMKISIESKMNTIEMEWNVCKIERDWAYENEEKQKRNENEEPKGKGKK